MRILILLFTVTTCIEAVDKLSAEPTRALSPTRHDADLP
jgi:hypothetical protein